jgi:FixJ family two-component response regulator
MRKRSICVVDDQAAVRQGLEAFLSDWFDLQCFESAQEFLDAVETIEEPDCLLIDLRMPGMDGHQLQEALKQQGFQSPIIFISGDADHKDVIKAWRQGAADFVLKPFSAAEIKSSIEALIESAQKQPEASIVSDELPITQREAQVLFLLGQGLRREEVAQRLGLSLRTVKMYRAFLKEKLKLHTPVELARFCDLNAPAIAKRSGL